MPRANRETQVSFVADSDVFEYLQQARNKTALINEAIRAHRRANAMTRKYVIITNTVDGIVEGTAYPVAEGRFGDCEACANAGETSAATFRQVGTAVKVGRDGKWRSHAGRLTDACYDCLTCYYPEEETFFIEGDQQTAIEAIRERQS